MWHKHDGICLGDRWGSRLQCSDLPEWWINNPENKESPNPVSISKKLGYNCRVRQAKFKTSKGPHTMATRPQDTSVKGWATSGCPTLEAELNGQKTIREGTRTCLLLKWHTNESFFEDPQKLNKLNCSVTFARMEMKWVQSKERMLTALLLIFP